MRDIAVFFIQTKESNITSVTFACGFNDLSEDIFGNFAVPHGGLPLLDPLSSSLAQQTAGSPHLPDEGPVLWV